MVRSGAEIKAVTEALPRQGIEQGRAMANRAGGLLTKASAWTRIFCNLAAHPRCVVGARRATFLGDRETLIYLAERRKGIVRFGDGEAGYLAGYSYRHQTQDESLRRKLVGILREYSGDSRALVAIPHDLVFGQNYDARKAKKEQWRAARWALRPYLKDGVTYGSAFCFRAGVAIDDDVRSYAALMASLFRGRDIIYVGNDEECPEIVPMRAIVKAPKQNAFERYDEIKRAAIREAGKYPQAAVMASCGITATALAWELNREGIPAYDVGLIFGKRLIAEWNAGARSLAPA
jgi:hypothetical protein